MGLDMPMKPRLVPPMVYYISIGLLIVAKDLSDVLMIAGERTLRLQVDRIVTGFVAGVNYI